MSAHEWEFITTDEFTEAECHAADECLKMGGETCSGSLSMTGSMDDGTMTFMVAAAHLNGPEWIVHMLRKRETEEGFDEIWAMTEHFADHAYVPGGGDELDCGECGESVLMHAESAS